MTTWHWPGRRWRPSGWSTSIPTPVAMPVVAVHHRSADWAELQPEWGLARNASFIVGPRTMTAGVDLRRRSFLHSYDAGGRP